MNDMMKQIGSKLNLAPHLVGPQKIEIQTCGGTNK
jgi:hypothetical protein